jgi:hypothetical protein
MDRKKLGDSSLPLQALSHGRHYCYEAEQPIHTLCVTNNLYLYKSFIRLYGFVNCVCVNLCGAAILRRVAEEFILKSSQRVTHTDR